MTAPKATLRTIAARAGVAPSTASLILRGERRFSSETVRRVLDSATALGYGSPRDAAKPVAPRATNVAAVVADTSSRETFRDGHTVDVLRGLHRTLGEHSMALALLPAIHHHRLGDAFENAPIDILFVLTTAFDTATLRDAAARRGVALAHLESGGPAAPPPMVTVDDVPPMRDLARHLLGFGHRTVASITMRYSSVLRYGLVTPGGYDQIENPIARNRLRGLVEGGLDPRYIFETAYANPTEAAEAVRVLMRLEPRPTAIVCQTDMLALGALTALAEMGLRVPQDVSVTGYDATLIPSLAPGRLTSVVQDGVLKGELLARIGLALRAGEAPPDAVLETFFLPGTTTGTAPTGG